MQKQTWAFIAIKGLLLLAVGLFFVFQPEKAVKVIAFYLGLILVFGGLVAGWNTYRIVKISDVSSVAYLPALVSIIAGLILLFLPEYALTVFALSIGIWVLFDGIAQVKGAKEVSKLGVGMGNYLLIMGILSIVLSVLIFFNPSGLIALMTVLFGIILVVSGTFLLILGLSSRN